MLTPILLHLIVFRLDYHANTYLARISTTPASHRSHRYLRHCHPTRSTRRHAQIRIRTGPGVLPLIDLPHDRSSSRSRRAVPIEDQRLHVLSLADRSLLDVVACGVGRDAHPDQVSGGESLLLSSRIGDSMLIRKALMSLQHPLHSTPESTLSTTPNPTPLDIPISQRPHPTYAEKSRAVYQSRQAAKLRLDALNAPAAVRYRESRGPAVQAIFRRNNEMSEVDRKAFERRRDYKYKTWGMRRLSPLRCETRVMYDDLGEPRYQSRFIFPEREDDWRSYPARVPLHPNLRNTQNNGLWGPKRTFQTGEDLAGDLPRARPIPKLARLGFVDLGPPFEKKRFPSAMEVYLASCKIRARRVFRFRDEDNVQLNRSLS